MKKPIKVEGSWIHAAKDYWIDLWDAIYDTESPDDMMPGVTKGVPMDQEWECNMCPYNHICNSRFHTKKR